MQYLRKFDVLRMEILWDAERYGYPDFGIYEMGLVHAALMHFLLLEPYEQERRSCSAHIYPDQ